MAHELAPPSYDAVVGAEKRRTDNTFELRSLSDPFGQVNKPPQYTRSQSTPERLTRPRSSQGRPTRNRRLRDVTIEEDEVFENPNLPTRAQSLRQHVRPRRDGRLRNELARQSYEDVRQSEDWQQNSCEDLRRADERLRKSFEDLRRIRRSNEDLSYLSVRPRERTYSAGYETLASLGDSRGGSPLKPVGGDQHSALGIGSPRKTPPVDSQYNREHLSNGNSPLSSTSCESRYSPRDNSNRPGDSGISSKLSNGPLSSSSRESNSSTGSGTPVKSLTTDPDFRLSLENNSNPQTFHPYRSEGWQMQTGHPSSLELEASDTQTEGFSSCVSTLEKTIKPDRGSVNNTKPEFDDYRNGAFGYSGASTFKFRDKPVNPVKPSFPVKPSTRMPSDEPASPSILKGAYRIDNMPPTPTKDAASAEFVFNFDPIKTALHPPQSRSAIDSDPLKVYTQYQSSEATKPRDGVIFDPAKLLTQTSETGSETGLSGTLKSNATNTSNATRGTDKSLDSYRQDYRALESLRASGDAQSEAGSDETALKMTSESSLERVQRVTERNRYNRNLRSRIKRLGCGVCQIIIGILLIATALLIFMSKSQGWFTCAGLWAGVFATIGGSLGILTHVNSKDLYVNIMIGFAMFNVCVIYLGTFCIGLSFGLVQMEKGGIRAFSDSLNFVYIILSLSGIVASVLQMSPIEKQRELKELEIAKCFVTWKTRIKTPGIDRTSSTSSSHGSQDQDGYRNYGYEASNYGDAVTTV